MMLFFPRRMTPLTEFVKFSQFTYCGHCNRNENIYKKNKFQFYFNMKKTKKNIIYNLLFIDLLYIYMIIFKI